MSTATAISTGSSGKVLLKKILLVCGTASSLLYIVMNIFVPMWFPGYNSASQTVSELSAVDAPTRSLWVIFGAVYTLLVTAFGWGVCKSSIDNRPLRIVGVLLIIYGLIGIGWPLVPMHQRIVLATGGGTISDTMHIAFSIVTVLLMLLIVGFGAATLGKRFRLYSIAAILVMSVFGALTGSEAPRLDANVATPWIGVWERISIGAYLLWVILLSIALLQKENRQHLSKRKLNNEVISAEQRKSETISFNKREAW